MTIYTEDDFLELNREILEKGNILRFRIKGRSMQPFIRDQEVVLIESCQPSELKIGDIIFYRVAPSKIVIHRFIRKIRNHSEMSFLTKGDANFHFDPPVNPADILGKILAIERNGKQLMLDKSMFKFKNYFYVECFLIKRWVFLIPRRFRWKLSLVLRKLQGTGIYYRLVRKFARGKINYRKATEEDVFLLARLFKVYYPYVKEKVAAKYFSKYLKDLKGVGCCFLSEYNKKIVGSVTIKKFPEDGTVYSGWRVYNRVVHWRYRRVGIGEKLVMIALKETIEMGADVVKCILSKKDICSVNLCKKINAHEIQGAKPDEVIFWLNSEELKRLVC